MKLLMLALFAVISFAAPITQSIGSTPNGDYGCLSPNAAWQAPQSPYCWVGPSEPVANGTTMLYTYYFNSPTAGTLDISVWADDTTNAFLNGKEFATRSLNLIENCTTAPGCRPEQGVHAEDLPTIAGLNKLSFHFYQLGGGPTGVYFQGAYTYDDGSTDAPEPSTLAAGLVTVAVVIRRIRK